MLISVFRIPGQSLDKKDDKGIWRTHDGNLAEYTKSVDRTNVSLFAEHNVLLHDWTLSLGVLAQRNNAFGKNFRFYPGVDVAYRPYGRLEDLCFVEQVAPPPPPFTELYYKSPSQEGQHRFEA